MSQFFVKKLQVPSLGDGEVYPAALHKILTQTVASSQIIEKLVFQKQRKIVKSQNDGKLGRNKSDTVLSQKGSRFSLWIVVVEENFA